MRQGAAKRPDLGRLFATGAVEVLRTMRHLVNAICLAAVLSTPFAIRADDEHHDKQDKRYYDAQRKDYHNWNEQEDQSYRRYLEERHREYRPYDRLSKSEQREYWTWRHNHPDRDRDRDRDDRR